MTGSWFPKPYAAVVQRLRVPFGFLLLAAYVLLAQPSPRSIAWGLPVSAFGLLLRGWAAGHLRKDSQLTTSGPYTHTRNPLYIGTLLAAGGLVIASSSLIVAAIYSLVFLLVYLPVIELEEQYLAQLFPAHYASYAARTPRLGWRIRGEIPRTASFSWELYWRNKEHKAGLAVLVAAAYLLVRIILFQ